MTTKLRTDLTIRIAAIREAAFEIVTSLDDPANRREEAMMAVVEMQGIANSLGRVERLLCEAA
jgi:hypothetical protein